MHEVKVDTEKNRIYLMFAKIEGEEEMQVMLDKIIEACGQLKSGFSCLTDLRKYDPVDGIFEKYIKKAQEALIDAGMKRVVRIRRPMGSMAHYQFDNISYELGYHAPNVTSMEEGEALLDRMEKQE